jgi:hypothetical protein
MTVDELQAAWPDLLCYQRDGDDFISCIFDGYNFTNFGRVLEASDRHASFLEYFGEVCAKAKYDDCVYILIDFAVFHSMITQTEAKILELAWTLSGSESK